MSQPVVWREWPDPIIVAYLTRLREMPSVERQRHWPSTWSLLRVALWRDKPRVLMLELEARLRAWPAPGWVTFGCDDPMALREYRAFWQELRSGPWTADARTVIAIGLHALRYRAIDPVAAANNYSLSMESRIPRQSLNWIDAPTA